MIVGVTLFSVPWQITKIQNCIVCYTFCCYANYVHAMQLLVRICLWVVPSVKVWGTLDTWKLEHWHPYHVVADLMMLTITQDFSLSFISLLNSVFRLHALGFSLKDYWVRATIERECIKNRRTRQITIRGTFSHFLHKDYLGLYIKAMNLVIFCIICVIFCCLHSIKQRISVCKSSDLSLPLLISILHTLSITPSPWTHIYTCPISFAIWTVVCILQYLSTFDKLCSCKT